MAKDKVTEAELKDDIKEPEVETEEVLNEDKPSQDGQSANEESSGDKQAADAEGTVNEDTLKEKGLETTAAGDKIQEDIKTQFLRLSADFQNYRRRTESEKADIYAYANEKIVLQVLEVIDNFDRAMSTAPEGDKFAEGMQLILKQLQDLLSKNNVTEIDALGKEFDPAFHNAVMTEAVEGTAPGIVTKVLQKGYTLNSKVIRPSMVAVSQ